MNYSDSKSCFAGERVERRLAAILVADVASYSRLMHANEERTHSRVMALLANTVAPAIDRHGGRVVKHTGDGLLAEFASAVDAVRAAMLFQDSIYESIGRRCAGSAHPAPGRDQYRRCDRRCP